MYTGCDFGYELFGTPGLITISSATVGEGTDRPDIADASAWRKIEDNVVDIVPGLGFGVGSTYNPHVSCGDILFLSASEGPKDSTSATLFAKATMRCVACAD